MKTREAARQAGPIEFYLCFTFSEVCAERSAVVSALSALCENVVLHGKMS